LNSQEEKGKNIMADEPELSEHLLAKAQDQKRKRSERFISDYANNVSVSISSWDMNITFGRVIGNNEIEETIEVIVSKEMAKALTMIMASHLKNYETQFGEIKIADLATLQETGKIPVQLAAKGKKPK
jgi:Protein of unknown function (DUF3467)